MKVILILFISIVVFATQKYSITVKVENLRNSQGIVLYTLYNKEGSLPDEKFQKYYKQIRANIDKNSSTAEFIDIPSGVYAVNVLHDENSNKKIDKGFLLPLEGVGLSNFNAINLLHRPNFKNASFNLESNITKTVKINYF